MTQIEELQGRILAAMERIGSGVGRLEQAHAAAKEEAKLAADTSVLEQALDEEKTVNAQLEERVKVLHARLQELEQAAPAAADAPDPGDMEALQAELELLRNEVGNTDEKDALKQEVLRLRAALESAGNGLAAEKEALEVQLSELAEQNQDLKLQISELSDAGDGDLGTAVDQAALEAEISALKDQLAQQAAAAPAQDSGELQELRSANAVLNAENESLRVAQARDQAQVNAVLAKLEPLLASAQHLPEGEEV
ncbi:coiled-coil domain-containing protein [Pseudophaeobacter flagellatus]|uniref:colicin transporter n=1 Tax=Pseudophaeobacter flagellatus TaxID=2899119 RepID=UPI001E5DB9F9|nr:colicin transporter [Pseudophaeobacter flagellatus]MCD9147737.1 colicin transporter [Pseudophaeobacter flagellatus]